MASANTQIKILHLEDNQRDADYVRDLLIADGLICDIRLAGGKVEFEQALANESFDVVLTDFNVPGFDGLSALQCVRTLQPEVPVIVISGSLGEEAAVQCIHQGATDYLLKDRLDRLSVAVRRALQESEKEQWRHRTEKALRKSEERVAAMFHSSPIAIAFGEFDGRLLDANAQLFEFFGYTRAEMIGRTTLELKLWAAPEDRAQCIEALRGGRTVRNFETRFRRKSGEIRNALVSMETLRLTDQPVLLTMIVDITERKTLEAQLQRMHRIESIGRLASGIAHDMNNILAPIMMSAPILRMNLGPEEMEKTIATIELSASRGATLVKQLLMFGRGVEGERGPVQMDRLIVEVLKIAKETFPKKIVLRSHIVSDTWPVRGDASQLHQVLLNLMVNARDAMPCGGTLTVEAKNVRLDEIFAATHPEVSPGPFVRLSVTDTGTGIPPQIVDKIFDPFFTTKAVGEGTGLGLSTVLGIVKNHGGLVSLHTEEKIGTTFEVYLPAITAGIENEIAPHPGTPPRGNNELILVVDDEVNIRTVLEKSLAAQGYRALVANDGAEATAMFARNIAEIKLVITDLDMPYMNGVSLARTLQRMKPEIKILVSSGLGSARNAREWAAEIEALGIPPILPKPYSMDVLLAAMHRLLAEEEPRGGTPAPAT